MAALLASKRATELANNAGWRIADVDVARFHCYRYQNSLPEFVTRIRCDRKNSRGGDCSIHAYMYV